MKIWEIKVADDDLLLFKPKFVCVCLSVFVCVSVGEKSIKGCEKENKELFVFMPR